MSLGLCTSCCGGTGQFRTITLNRACLTVGNFNFYVLGQNGTLPAPSTANTIIPFCAGPQYLTNAESLSQPDGTGSPGDFWSGYRQNHDIPPAGASTITQGTNVLSTSWDDYTWDQGSISPYQYNPSNFSGFPSGSVTKTWTTNSYTESYDGSDLSAPYRYTYTCTLGSEMNYSSALGGGATEIASSTFTSYLTSLTWGTNSAYYYNDNMALPPNDSDTGDSIYGVDYSSFDDSIQPVPTSGSRWVNWTPIPASMAFLEAEIATFNIAWIRSQVLYTGPYVLITYVLILSGDVTEEGISCILDPVSPCAGSGTGDGVTPIDIPVPSITSMPSSLYPAWNSSTGTYASAPPYGRITKFIPGWSSCSAYLAANPHG